MPPSHLIALSHATSGCVGVSGRLKKHGRLRPSIQKSVRSRQHRETGREEVPKRERETEWKSYRGIRGRKREKDNAGRGGLRPRDREHSAGSSYSHDATKISGRPFRNRSARPKFNIE